MKLTKRRIAVGALSAAVVVTMTGVTTWALAGEGDKPAPPAGTVRLIVGYRDGADVAGAAAAVAGQGARRTLSSAVAEQALTELNASAVEVPAAGSAQMIANLRSNPDVEYVEVDHVRRVFDLRPNDPLYQEGYQPEIDEMLLPKAWQTTTGSAVKIAVLDSGVNSIDDLRGRVLRGYDFVNNDSNAADDHFHGTAVAAVLAAKGNNGIDMAGACWNCQILPVKVMDNLGRGYDSTIARGVTWAVKQGAKVINLSLGGPDTSSVLADAIAYANMNNVLVVAAAGNDGKTVKQYPAAYPDVVAVGATGDCTGADPNGCKKVTKFSQRNSSTGSKWVDVAAPGIVTSMDNYGTAVVVEGTSFSAPIVSGIAGLIKSKHTSYTGWELANALQQGAKSRKIAGITYGKVDAGKSLTIGTENTPPTSSGISPGANAYVRGTISVRALNLKDLVSGIRKADLSVNGTWKGYSRTSPYAVKFNTAGRRGAVKLQLRVYDKAGNLLTLNRTVNVDNVKPTAKITSAPRSGATVRGTVTIKFTGSDNAKVRSYQLLINGKVSQQRTSIGAFRFAASAAPTRFTVQVRAVDMAGNTGVSKKYSYRR